jgi:VWFA-related protein
VRVTPQLDPGQHGRKFVFLFDAYATASAQKLVQARRAAVEFARERMRPGDMGAVYEVNPYLSAVAYFTADIGELVDSIEKIRYHDSTPLGEQITDATTLEPWGYHGTREDVEARMRNSAQFASQQYEAEQSRYFESLEVLGQVLQEEPGRKVVLLFSGGFPLAISPTERASGGFTLIFQRMVRQMEKSRAAVYTFSIGEEQTSIDAEERTTYRDTLDLMGFGMGFLDEMGQGIAATGDTAAARNQVMAVIAHESGGRFFPGRDYEASLESVDDDNNHYYLIGYLPIDPFTAKKQREKYISLKIKLRDSKGRVFARRGRFLPPEQAAEQGPTGTISVGAKPVAPPPEPETAVSSETAGYTLGCAPISFAAPSGETVVTLPLLLSGPIRPIAADSELYELDLSVRLVARKGGLEFERRERSYRATLNSQALEPLERGLRLIEALELPAGRYALEATLRVNGLDIEAAWREEIDVETFESDGFALSGVTRLADRSAPPLVANVFTAGRTADSDGMPSTDPLRLANDWQMAGTSETGVLPSKPLALFFRVYDPAIDPATGMPAELSLDYRLIPAGGGEEILPPIQLAYFKGALEQGAFDVVVQIDLGAVEAGDYELRIDARDGKGARRAERILPVRVASASKILNSSN